MISLGIRQTFAQSGFEVKVEVDLICYPITNVLNIVIFSLSKSLNLDCSKQNKAMFRIEVIADYTGSVPHLESFRCPVMQPVVDFFFLQQNFRYKNFKAKKLWGPK